MNFSPPDIFFIQTLPVEHLNRAISSYNNTVGKKWGEQKIQVIKELDTRESTLNQILKLRKPQRDLFIVADDIVFTPGWYEHLERNIQNGDIIGFAMKYPNSERIQNFGFDFVLLDGVLSYRGRSAESKVNEIDLPEYRICDAITGCAMYIKQAVLLDIKSFPLEGANRWGEMIFSHHARQEGYQTIVLSAMLEHLAISTKQKTDAKQSSLSWMIEKDLWEVAKNKHFADLENIPSMQRKAAERLAETMKSGQKILIYGCGTIANYIAGQMNPRNYTVCAGLQEEVGLDFHGTKVIDVRHLELNAFDTIIITPIGYLEKILPLFQGVQDSKLFMIVAKTIAGNILYEMAPIKDGK